ncbi:hypothetical protein [Limnobacter sp.]|uniref:hypothetical protein n=1 Tax=Limnobacter sp. TaxID=2003368 RepID=UPI003514BD53
MWNNSKRSQTGASMVNMIIASGLLVLLISSGLSAYTYTSSSAPLASSNEQVNQLTRLVELFGSHVNRGGAYLDAAGEAKGIQICHLDDQARRCKPYQSQKNNLCLALPTQLGNGALASIEVRGFRLHNGVMQQRTLSKVNLGTFGLHSFCTSENAWENLHSAKDFVIQSLALCKFKASTMDEITTDYSRHCDSVLSTEPQSAVYWIALFTVRSAKPGAPEVIQNRIIQLFNDTRVTTL